MTERTKPKYESPVLVPLGTQPSGAGDCTPGSNPLFCTPGSSATSMCQAGDGASGCTDGTAASTSCTPGDGGIVPACNPGIDDT